MTDNCFNDKDVLTTGEVAKICNVASRTVSKWFDSGQLDGYRIPGSKDRRIPVASLLTFMKAHNIPMDGLMSGTPRILVVDGDPAVGDTLKRVLTDEAEFDVHTTNSLFQAGIECERFRPHVVLFDVDMAGDAAAEMVDVVQSNDELQATRLVAIELVENACPLPDFRHPQDALYVFGPEDGNLPQDIVDAAHEVVYVPTVGCMNLAATVNVVLYDRMAKQGLKSDKSGNELIRASRDNNNHLQVRS